MPASPSRILVVEDEPAIRQGLCDVLVFRGYTVESSANGREALEMALSALGKGEPSNPESQRSSSAPANRYDLILLDIMLPELDGYTICRTLREEGETCPILMLTAKGSEEDVLLGFDAGADDYVTKPFSVRELLARVQALLKRHHRFAEETFRAEPFEVLPQRGIARLDGEEIELTTRELHILSVLSREPGRIISRRALLREVWDMKCPEQVETRTVDVHIGKLRKKLGPEGVRHLETVRGQGYRWQ